MRMMRVPEAVKALGDGMTSSRIYYGIRAGIYRSVKVGGVILVDYDEVKHDCKTYMPRAQRPDGLVSFTRLCEVTGLGRRQVEAGVAEGWIVPVVIKRRKLYDVAAVQRELKGMLGGDRL